MNHGANPSQGFLRFSSKPLHFSGLAAFGALRISNAARPICEKMHSGAFNLLRCQTV